MRREGRLPLGPSSLVILVKSCLAVVWLSARIKTGVGRSSRDGSSGGAIIMVTVFHVSNHRFLL